MQRLDTNQDIDTPEGIAISLSPVGPIVRALAWMIDSLIFVGALMLIGTIVSIMGEFGMGLYLIALFFLYWFYPVFFEVLSSGATPGKKAMNIRVLHIDGTPVGWAASINRNLLRTVDFLPFMYAFGFISMLLNNRFQRIGDVVAGTMVVYNPGQIVLPEITAADPSPPAYPLAADEQRAILNFAERLDRLSKERSDELAALTGPLISNSTAPSKELLAIANWINGRRT